MRGTTWNQIRFEAYHMTLKLPENSSEYSSNRFLYCSMVVRRAWSLGKSKATDIVPSSFRMVVPGNMMVLLRRHHFSKDMIGDQGSKHEKEIRQTLFDISGQVANCSLALSCTQRLHSGHTTARSSQGLGSSLGFRLRFRTGLGTSSRSWSHRPTNGQEAKILGRYG